MFCSIYFCFCFFKQKTAYEMRISDWSSDVCSSDLASRREDLPVGAHVVGLTGWQDYCVADVASPDMPFTVLPDPLPAPLPAFVGVLGHTGISRSEESRVGKECVSTCMSRWSQYQ